jgi:hypothetical protein
MTTKVLMSNITEGRARILGLMKLNYSIYHPFYIRCLLDLANSYALQGLWEQVSEYITLAKEILTRYSSQPVFTSSLNRTKLEARLTCCVFTCIRDSCSLNNGQVVESLLDEVYSLLRNEVNRTIEATSYMSKEDKNKILQYPIIITESIKTFLIQSKFG